MKAGASDINGYPFAPCTLLPHEGGKQGRQDFAIATENGGWGVGWELRFSSRQKITIRPYITAITILCSCKATSAFNESFQDSDE